MKTNNFETGTPVKVLTDKGIVDGVIAFYWRGTTTNQFLVEFVYDGDQKCSLTFSKKTGKLYNYANYKHKYIKVLFE